ncbi:MAG: hypothetical protein ACREL7_05535 [Longimicrobiales bacterium]
MKSNTVGLALLLTLAMPAPALARQAEPNHDPLRPLRIAKWGTLAMAAGAATFGFVHNGRADDLFANLEQLCQDQPVRCLIRNTDGSYQDPEFERLYKDVRALDRRAHAALLLSQIGLGASVVFFLLDLGNSRRPPDIPFSPTAVNFEPRPDGSLALSIRLPWPDAPFH